MEALCGLGHVARLRGAPDDAVQLYREALQARTASSSEPAVREALLGLGVTLYQSGDHAEGRQHLDEAQVLVEASGSAVARVTTWTVLGEVARDRGDLERALEHYRRAAELDQAIGRDSLVPRLNLGVALVASERFEEGRELLLGVLEAARARRSVVETFAMSALLVCDAAARRWSDFDATLLAVLEVVDGRGVVEMDLGRLLHQAGKLALAAGMVQRSELSLGAALRQFRALGRDDLVRKVRRDLLGEGR
jgi:tetratricopeptide (TPR) repeat protein